MDAKNRNNTQFCLKKIVKVVLLASPFLISACGDADGGYGSIPKGITQPSKGELTVPKSDRKPEITPKRAVIKQDVRAATVQINVVGDAVLPKGLGSVDIQKRGSGSGFFIDDTGYIVTNNHVVTGAGKLTVTVDGVSRPYYAETVGVAECEDIAVLKTTTGKSGFAALSWAEDVPTIGLEVGVSGFPGDVRDSVAGDSVYAYSTGTINTDIRPHNTTWASTDIFNHSAITAPGGSGGPVVDLDTGAVVGIHYAGGSSRFLAISVSEAKDIVDEIMGGRDVLSIGISAEVVFKYRDESGSNRLAFLKNIPDSAENIEPFGVWVNGLEAGGKAKTIGLQPGDIITAIGGVKLQYDRTDDDKARRAKRTMGEYCGVLRTNDPNKGTVLDIEIYRPKAGGITCTGEINGKLLGLKEDPDVSCPSQPPERDVRSDTSGDYKPGKPAATGRAETTLLYGTLDHSDYLADSGTFEGRHIDMYPLYALSSGEVAIEMRSPAIDSYLIVALINPDGENIDDFWLSDDTGSSRDARVSFYKQAGREYVIFATSAIAGETGPYELRFIGFDRWETPAEYGVEAASTSAPAPRLLQNLESILPR